MAACSSDGSGTYKIDGRLLNINYGEFYVYSPDGAIEGIDTLFVLAGRFSYKGSCDKRGTLVVVFPNFSEQPLFVAAGKNIKIRGDASHLKELKVSGGAKDNKLFTAFRQQTADATTEQTRAAVRQFVAAHPESLAAVYIVERHFIRCVSPDYTSAYELLEMCRAAQPDNGLLAQDVAKIAAQRHLTVGAPLPPFMAVSIAGDTITDKTLSKGTAVVYLWASYDYEGCNVQRLLRDAEQEGLHTLGLCIDTSLKDCQRVVARDKITSPVVCGGRAFDDSLVQLFGMNTFPDNVVVEDGVVRARGLTTQELRGRFPAAKK